MSLKDSIASADDVAYEDVAVPEWNIDKVRVQSVTLAKREELRGVFGDGVDYSVADASAEVLAATLHDPDTGALVFVSVGEAKEVLTGRNAAVVDRLVAVASRVLGFDTSAAEQIEGAKKSSVAK